MQDIAARETIIEYIGEVIHAEEAERRHPHDPSQPNHTFYFQVSDEVVIDATYGGNSSRWINHSCAPTATRSSAMAASSLWRCALSVPVKS